VNADPSAHLLPLEESRRRFDEQIVPQRLAHGVRQERPVLVIVAGPPGSGKTAVENRVRADLGGGAVVVDADAMRIYHPDYVTLALRNDRLASPATHPDATRWANMAVAHCIEHGYDLVLSTTLRTAATVDYLSSRVRPAAYRIEIAALAVHEAASRLGVLRRYQDGRDDAGFGRYVPTAFQQDAYGGLLSALDRVDDARLADVVNVYRRDGHLLYHNELGPGGDWVRPPGARAAVEAGRARSWSAEEITVFLAQAEGLRARLPADLHEDLRIAVQAARDHIAASGGTPDVGGFLRAAFPSALRAQFGARGTAGRPAGGAAVSHRFPGPPARPGSDQAR